MALRSGVSDAMTKGPPSAPAAASGGGGIASKSDVLDVTSSASLILTVGQVCGLSDRAKKNGGVTS
jgi:hypothetical protein